MLSLGIESESDEVRRDMMKKLEREKIKTAIQNLRKARIKSFAFFIFGYPGDTPASIRRTASFAREIEPDFANFYPAVPYPGTEMYEKCKRDGLLVSDDWSKMEYSYYLLRGNGAGRSRRDECRAVGDAPVLPAAVVDGHHARRSRAPRHQQRAAGAAGNRAALRVTHQSGSAPRRRSPCRRRRLRRRRPIQVIRPAARDVQPPQD